MNANETYIPFSQRTGLSPIPPQLKLGEVSADLRRFIDYCVSKEIGRVEHRGSSHFYFNGKWQEVATDLHVHFFRQPVSTFENRSYTLRANLERLITKATIGQLFDLVEFFARHLGCSSALKSDLADAFTKARAAYRVIDGKIVAIGTEEQATAFEAAISDAQSAGASAARQHLIASGVELRNGNWADSVRESIHAVEAMARKIEPSAQTLGPALKALERNGYIHGSLKMAFEKLYGYTNDENGIRHALQGDVSRVDEVDALFVLGACASFVSYLISRDLNRSTTATD